MLLFWEIFLAVWQNIRTFALKFCHSPGRIGGGITIPK